MEANRKKCRELLKKFHELTPKEKRTCITLFSTLLEKNKEKAKEVYFDFEDIFDSFPELELSKEELHEVCGELKNPKMSPDITRDGCLGILTKLRGSVELDDSEKKKYIKCFENLLEEKDISYAFSVYKESIRYFLEKDYLEDLGKKFLERYKSLFAKKGEDWEYKKFYESLIAIAIENILEDYLSSPELSKAKEYKMIDLFDNLCRNSPKLAYEFSNGSGVAEKIEQNPLLKGVKERHWEALKKAREQFFLDGKIIDKASREVVGDKVFYLRKNEVLDKFEEEKAVSVLFLGEEGSGKTTLINSMANYLSKVGYDDEVRLKLIKEKPQTEKVSTYIIKPTSKVFNRPIRLIDVPGFGDTKERNEQIKKNFEDFIINECPKLNGICFVMKSNNSKITETQKYIVDKVFSLFGNDTKDNIFGLFTFADGSDPEVIEVIKTENIPISEDNIFPFNNSGIIQRGETKNFASQIGERLFDLEYQSFRHFFNRIRQITPVEIGKTKEVIQSRREIDSRLNNLLSCINAISFQTAIENQLKACEGNSLRKILKEIEDKEEEIKSNREEIAKNLEILDEAALKIEKRETQKVDTEKQSDVAAKESEEKEEKEKEKEDLKETTQKEGEPAKIELLGVKLVEKPAEEQEEKSVEKPGEHPGEHQGGELGEEQEEQQEEKQGEQQEEQQKKGPEEQAEEPFALRNEQTSCKPN